MRKSSIHTSAWIGAGACQKHFRGAHGSSANRRANRNSGRGTACPTSGMRDILYPSSASCCIFWPRKSRHVLTSARKCRSSVASMEGTPTLRQHHHVIVLFPYFDARGSFQVVVMERNQETSLASLLGATALSMCILCGSTPRASFPYRKLK